MRAKRQALVLVPGMMCDERLFAPQSAYLSASCDIWIPDIGRKASIRELAQEALTSCPFPAFALCGLSMGGIVAMEMARQSPDRIERLALLDTNHLADAPERHEIRNRQISAARSGGFERVVAEEMMPFYFSAANKDDATLRGLVMAMARDVGARAFVNQSIALRDRNGAEDVVAAYARPMLVLCGAEDIVCPVSRHQAISALNRRAELRIVAAAGHLSTLEQPAHVNAALESWLTRKA
jgi:pimeloyl-ACP methyl ester carboxylesterase